LGPAPYPVLDAFGRYFQNVVTLDIEGNREANKTCSETQKMIIIITKLTSCPCLHCIEVVTTRNVGIQLAKNSTCCQEKITMKTDLGNEENASMTVSNQNAPPEKNIFCHPPVWQHRTISYTNVRFFERLSVSFKHDDVRTLIESAIRIPFLQH